MVTAREAGDSRRHDKPTRARKEKEVLMYQLTTQQLADDLRRQQLADAEQQRTAQHLLALRRAISRTERAERRMRRAMRQAQRRRAQLEA
jgi:hypothetical protein